MIQASSTPFYCLKFESKSLLLNSVMVFLSFLSADKVHYWGFPGGAVVKNPPANAQDTGSSPGPGRSHIPQSN